MLTNEPQFKAKLKHGNENTDFKSQLYNKIYTKSMIHAGQLAFISFIYFSACKLLNMGETFPTHACRC